METRANNNYQQYEEDLQNILFALNEANSIDEQAYYLSSLQKCDKGFIDLLNNSQNTKIKSIFFTRHGLCSISQKNYGFAPNTPVEETALIPIEASGSVTKNMFSNEPNSKLCIAISPMIRARQTASKIIPNQMTGSIEIKNFLTENSSNPSGKPYLDVESLGKKTNLMSYVSSINYHDSYFVNLNELLNLANEEIQNKSIFHTLFEDSQENFNFSDKTKINLINSYIDNHTNNGDIDIWFIGHGKNTNNYFNIRYLINNPMDYCETRKVIRFNDVNDNALEFEFVTPYILRIDQSTGLFLGEIYLLDKEPIIMFSNPIQFIEQYIKERGSEHNISVENSKLANYQALKNVTFFVKSVLNIDYLTKINAAHHLLLILQGKNQDPLSESEISALNNARLGAGLKKYNIDIYVLNDGLKIKMQQSAAASRAAGAIIL